MQERINNNTALFDYEFDFNVDPAMAGLDSAMHGDFATAVTNPGVSIAPGSYVEHEFIRRTSIGLQLFDLGTFTAPYIYDPDVAKLARPLFSQTDAFGATEMSFTAVLLGLA